MKRNMIETLVGALVLFVAVFFVHTAINSSGVSTQNGYDLFASFESIDGIGVGSDVRIGGVKIGTVTGQKLNVQTYRPQLTLNLRDDIKLPLDSSAGIVSEGLLGGKYVNLLPGADEEFLSAGEEIEFTQSSVNIEQLIGKFAFGSAEEK